MQDWKDIRKKAEELNSTKACLINDETSWWILKGRYVNFQQISHRLPRDPNFTCCCEPSFSGDIVIKCYILRVVSDWGKRNRGDVAVSASNLDPSWLPSGFRTKGRQTWCACHVSVYLPIPVAPTWGTGHPWNASFHSFLNPRHSVGLLGRGTRPTQGRCLHRTTQT
jgi:hypothetical protein